MIQENLFDLTSDQIDQSKMIYNDKVIKCLVAPYHTYSQLEKLITYTPATYLFPEREMNIPQLRSLISMVVGSDKKDEVRIITANQNVIMDMIDSSVRVLTEGGDVVPSPCKTFMANIHDIRYNLLENGSHQLSKEEKSQGVDEVNRIISIIQTSKTLSKDKFDILMTKIRLIGEPIIRNRLVDMSREISII